MIGLILLTFAIGFIAGYLVTMMLNIGDE